MRHLRRRGFTLVELLVVVGMIVLLATILLPMVNRAYVVANRSAMASDLMVISQAIEAYKGDFGDYPQIYRPITDPGNNYIPMQGAAALCWSLVAPGPASSNDPNNPGDGADGPGFRIRGTIGPVKGPYLPPDRFLIGTADGEGLVHPPGLLNGTKTSFNNMQDVLADRMGSPIVYFPATHGVSPTSPPNGFVKPKYEIPYPKVARSSLPHPAVFNFDDNGAYLTPGANASNPANLTRGGWPVMSYRLGDANCDGTIDNGEVAITTGPYLLWSAGPDMIFGNDDDVMCDGTQLQQVTGPLP